MDEKGEITVFLSLSLILMISLVFSLMESASIQLAKNYRRADINRALECVFAEYHGVLFERYHVLSLDAAYESEIYDPENVLQRINFYASGDAEHRINRIRLLTDGNGKEFFYQACTYMQHKFGLDKMDEILGEKENWEKNDREMEKTVKEEEDTEENLEKMLAENEAELPEENNPISHVGSLKSTPLLELIWPKELSLSQKQIVLSEQVSQREKNEGYGEFSDIKESSNAADRILFGEYILDNFKSASDRNSQDALDYQIEYFLIGSASDRENLEAVAKKIMLLRFAANYLYLQTDAGKKAEAEALAAALCSVIALPAMTEVAAQAILLAWAFGESVMDMRSLLKGGRVPPVKDAATWQLQLSSLVKLGTREDGGSAAVYDSGLNYKDYLRMMVYLENPGNHTMRALDLIEMNLRKTQGADHFRADACINKLEVRTTLRLRRGITYDFNTYFGYR